MQSLNTGTSKVDSFRLSAQDICRIIKQCHQSQVSELVLSDLTLKFHSQRNENASELGQAKDHVESPIVVETKQEQKTDFELSTYLDDEEAQLLVEEPASYERLQIDKYIGRERPFA